MRTFLTFLFAIGLIACSAEHGGTHGSSDFSSIEATSLESVQAFENTVYSLGKSQGCVKCHGGTVNPLWLNSDPARAYSFARPLIDFANPLASDFINYSSNNHCGDSACQNPGTASQMQDMLLQWAAIELNLTGNGLPSSTGTTLANPPFVTLPISLPATIPVITSSSKAVVRFSLSQVTPAIPALNGAILEFSVQYYNAAHTTYKIFDPRIYGNSGPISLSGIHVYIRPAASSGLGQEFVNQGCIWSTFNRTVAATPGPATLPPGPVTSIAPLVSTSLAIPVQSASDVITVGFADIH